MSLPKKNTRKITLSSGTYRWLVRRDAKNFTLITELAENPSRRLQVKVPLKLFPDDAQILSPALVRQCIEHALNTGYSPTTQGKEHRVTLSEGDLNFGKVNQEELKKRPVGRPRKRAPGEKRRPVYLSLDPPDRARLEAIATARSLPLGTLARTWILERLDSEEAAAV